SRLNVLTKASAMPFDSGLCTGVKHGTRPRAAAKSSVSLAVKGLPLSDSHSTACGAWIVAKRSSTASSIRSRTIEPLTPTPATACQASTSRSWASMTKTMRTISPFQQVISKTSEHQRRFERITTTLPSCRRPLRAPLGRPPHKNSRAAPLQPGDEVGTYTYTQLLRMDRRYVAAAEEAIRLGPERRTSGFPEQRTGASDRGRGMETGIYGATLRWARIGVMMVVCSRQDALAADQLPQEIVGNWCLAIERMLPETYAYR